MWMFCCSDLDCNDITNDCEKSSKIKSSGSFALAAESAMITDCYSVATLRARPGCENDS